MRDVHLRVLNQEESEVRLRRFAQDLQRAVREDDEEDAATRPFALMPRHESATSVAWPWVDPSHTRACRGCCGG
jgi:hypothetical protein